ncbi:hypothetical protein SAMN06265219_11573 [Gracilimonas mengyeensis]|uniref:Uncharacterized protein n=1 Tax=Gracilimonas mengyeensis TaxID=1302730 RepID=A0A521F5F6_9BACT|nr:hypothetical protein SAMN06265219_11573 [Gracilimonas mengyeensis]
MISLKMILNLPLIPTLLNCFDCTHHNRNTDNTRYYLLINNINLSCHKPLFSDNMDTGYAKYIITTKKGIGRALLPDRSSHTLFSKTALGHFNWVKGIIKFFIG